VADVQETNETETAAVMVLQTKMSVVVEEEEDDETGRRDDGEQHGISASANSLLPLAPSPRRRVARSFFTAIALLVVLITVLIAGAIYWLRTKPRLEGQAGAIKSLAVLPFKSINAQSSTDGNEDYLGIGMADVTITRLGSLDQLVVRPTRSVLGFATQDPLQSGETLRVDAVLDGSIQQSGDRIRVTLRLLRVADGKPLWTDQFDERGTDIFALQDSISRKVTEALALQISGAQQEQLARHYTENADAYRAYIKGRYYRNRFTTEGARQAIESFNQAISIDQNYALAYAGLADAYYWSANLFLPGPEAMLKAKEAGQHALALDEQLAEAHLALGQVLFLYDWQFGSAEQHFKRALALNPGLAEAHSWYGQYLSLLGRFDDGLAEMKRAEQYDPLSPVASSLVGLPLFLMGRYDEANAVNFHALETNPNSPMMHANIGIGYAQKGEGAKAVAEFQQVLKAGGDTPEAEAMLACGYAVAGNRAAANQTLKQALDSPREDAPSPYTVALVYIAMGDKGQGFAWLEKAYAARSEYMVWLKVDPRLNGLRSDPRFADLMRRVGLTD
jgi:TolB-like protein/Flp pilus assembly protein TadD